jgi:chaperonin cofactor prefoldin
MTSDLTAGIIGLPISETNLGHNLVDYLAIRQAGEHPSRMAILVKPIRKLSWSVIRPYFFAASDDFSRRIEELRRYVDSALLSISLDIDQKTSTKSEGAVDRQIDLDKVRKDIFKCLDALETKALDSSIRIKSLETDSAWIHKRIAELAVDPVIPARGLEANMDAIANRLNSHENQMEQLRSTIERLEREMSQRDV